MLTPTELDRRPEGPAAVGGGASTVAVDAHQRPARASRHRTTPRPAARRRRARCRPWRCPSTAPRPLRRCCTAGSSTPGADDATTAGARPVALDLGRPRRRRRRRRRGLVVPRRSRLPHRRAADDQASRYAQAAERHARRRTSAPTGSTASTRRCPRAWSSSTDPGAGAEVRRGTDVTVTVSKGPERYAVPNVVGQVRRRGARPDHRRQARRRQRSRRPSTRRSRPGSWSASTPRSGTQLKRGTKVDLVVCQGPAADRGHRLHQQAGRPRPSTPLTKAGLEVDATEQENSDTVAKGNVISPDPARRHPVQGRHGHARRLQGPGAGHGARRRRASRRPRPSRSSRPPASRSKVGARHRRHLRHRPRQDPGGRHRGSPRASTITLVDRLT